MKIFKTTFLQEKIIFFRSGFFSWFRKIVYYPKIASRVSGDRRAQLGVILNAKPVENDLFLERSSYVYIRQESNLYNKMFLLYLFLVFDYFSVFLVLFGSQ